MVIQRVSRFYVTTATYLKDSMENAPTKNYKELARQARVEILSLIHKAGTSHIASNFSVIDIATVLYANLKPEDEVVWSAGWKAATIYYFLWKQGKITREQLESFPNTPFFGLAETSVPGVHVSGGSMGQGASVAVGMAIARKRAGKPGVVHCILSDGEHQEGSTWEAILLAGNHNLNNLIFWIDNNGWTAMGRTKDVADLEPFEDKYLAFKWKVARGDGHNHDFMHDVLTTDFTGINFGNLGGASAPWATVGDESLRGKPMAVICDTIKGKGVRMFENLIMWHYAHVDENVYKKAMKELS